MTVPIYEIYAVKYAGPVRGKLAFVLWNEGWDTDADRNYYVWAIKGNDEILVVDAGCGARLAAERQLEEFVNPIDLLAKIGANKTNVKKIILTHLHWDHAGGFEMFLQAFPQAILYAQKKELDFWAKNRIAKRAPFAKVSDERTIEALGRIEGTPRLRLVSGDADIMPGIQVILAPGHTIGLQAVAVNTSKGTAILASDCSHVHENVVQDTPSCLITDLIAWMESFDKLRANASSIDLIFPGHDVKMLTDFPKEAEGVTRLV
jgi:glyoxylase-like metal-dependent hydrolase (beta-lactamase superfamily II)